jgi:hypothetical protein
MNEFDILYIIWMWVLPALGMMFTVLVPIIWVFIIPKISKKLMWARFRNSSIIAMADDSGWAELVVTTKTLPEGIHQTKEHGWRFMLRPRWKKPLGDNPTEDQIKRREREEQVEQLASRKYVLKDLGKPFWYGYDGKVTLVNPPTLAALQQSSSHIGNPTIYFAKIEEFVKRECPEHIATPLKGLVEELKENLEREAHKITILDPKIIKEVLPLMNTPSQIGALAANRERYGELKRGHDYGKLALVAIVVLGMVAVVIAIGYFAMR